MSGGPLGQNRDDAMDSTPLGSVGTRPSDVLNSNELGIEYDQLLPETPQIILPPEGPPGVFLPADGTRYHTEHRHLRRG